MAAVMAGWLCGYAMSIASTIAFTFLVARARNTTVFEQWVDAEVSGVLLAVPIFLGNMVMWTMFGMMFGSAYELGNFKSHADFLGSPSGPFLLAMVGVAWLPLPPLIIFFRARWWLWLAMSLLFLGLFGWVMPLLAER